jgi:hypothetical protein
MKWNGKEIFISETLIGERVGLTPITDEDWKIQFSHITIGSFNERLLEVQSANV